MPIALILAILPVAPPPLRAQETPDAAELIERVESLMRSDRAISEMTMEVITPHWRRTMAMRSYDDRNGDKSFIHILSPARDKDTTFLRLERNLWIYSPRTERTIRIPPSMMLQSWMGSDFNNDDLVRESSYVRDYSKELADSEEVAGLDCYRIILLPKPDVAVTWGRVEVWISKEPLLPVRYRFFNRRNELRKEMEMSEVRELDGHLIPTVLTMRTVDKPGQRTVIKIDNIDFDAEIPERVFRREHLRNPR